MSHSPTVQDAKAALREEARRRRGLIDEQARVAASAAIAERAIALIAPLRVQSLAAYFAVRGEVDPRAILAWAERTGIVCALPSVHSGYSLVFRQYRAHDPLVGGSFGVPSPSHEAPEIVPDLLVVPLLAFDRTGTRLGYGRGFYDRGIQRLRQQGVDLRLVGVAFAAQEVPAVPAEPHDVRLDWIVTEQETIDLRVVNTKG
jgi:5-formyltetrahydrofolate cyclo-ligase